VRQWGVVRELARPDLCAGSLNNDVSACNVWVFVCDFSSFPSSLTEALITAIHADIDNGVRCLDIEPYVSLRSSI
jgi:hypothetical protein